jgi:hypothetical protein
MNGETPMIQPTPRDGASLYVAIGVMMCIAAAFVVVTFTMFINSSAYKTVQDIQANAKINGPGLSDYDTTSPVKTADIDETIKGIENKMQSLDNQADYGPDGVSDSALGVER